MKGKKMFKYIELFEAEEIMLEFIKSYGNKIITKKTEKEEKDLTFEYRYTLNLLNKLIEIDQKIKDLHISFDLIFNVYPNYTKVSFTRKDYLIYHIEYFLINTVAVFDRLLHLINFIYNLNLKGQAINIKNIENKKTVDKEVIELLKEIKVNLLEVTKIRKIQNNIKHKAKYNDIRIYNFELTDYIAENTEDLYKKELLKQAALSYYKKYRKRLKAEMDYLIFHTEIATKGLLKILSPKIKAELIKNQA